MATTMVAFKIEKADAEQFKIAVSEYGLDQSKFLRACVDQFMQADKEGREKILSALGFKKKVSWTRE